MALMDKQERNALSQVPHQFNATQTAIRVGFSKKDCDPHSV